MKQCSLEALFNAYSFQMNWKRINNNILQWSSLSFLAQNEKVKND